MPRILCFYFGDFFVLKYTCLANFETNNFEQENLCWNKQWKVWGPKNMSESSNQKHFDLNAKYNIYLVELLNAVRAKALTISCMVVSQHIWPK